MIAKTLRDLPQGIIPPSYQKVNPADSPIIFYSFTSDLMPLSQLDEYAETFMAQRISMVPGVAQVNVYGAAEVRGAHPARSDGAREPRSSASTKWRARSRARTSICRRAS